MTRPQYQMIATRDGMLKILRADGTECFSFAHKDQEMAWETLENLNKGRAWEPKAA